MLERMGNKGWGQRGVWRHVSEFGRFPLGASEPQMEATCSDSRRSSSSSTQLSGGSDMGYWSIEYNAAPSTGHFHVAPKHPNTHTNTQITTRPERTEYIH